MTLSYAFSNSNFFSTSSGFALLLMCVMSATADELRVGTAAVKITPPTGIPMAGYYSRRDSQGVLDDLYAKAAVLDDGKTKAAIVICDLIGLTRPVVVEARRLVLEKTGIPTDNVMISATHTHTAPVLLSGSARDDAATGGSQLSKDYIEQLPKWIAQAVSEAHGRRTPARVYYATENETKLAFIRRFWMKDGSVGWNPGVKNPNIIRPIGAVDPQVNIVYAETAGRHSSEPVEQLEADGSRTAQTTDVRPLLTFVNFAMHLDTTGGVMISADYPATLARLLPEYKGPEMLTMFANGACGNINHINVNWDAKQSSPESAKRIGIILAADVMKAYAELQPVEEVAIRVRRKVVKLLPAKYTDEELRKARELDSRAGKGSTLFEAAKAYRILDLERRQGKPFYVEVQVFALGRDIAWVALPGEVFVELGLSIKTASPFRQTNVIELSNGINTYIPNRSAFAEGQYEVISTRCAEGAGELLVTVAIRLLSELYE